MMFKQALIVSAAALVCGAFNSSVLAHGGLGGLMPYVDNGKLVTGHYDAHSGTGLVTDTGPTYVYIGEMEANWESSGMPGANHPGIVTDGESADDPDGQNYLFPANTALVVTANLLPDLNCSLAYWDGNGAVDFTAAIESLSIDDGFNSITVSGGSGVVSGSVSPWTSDTDGLGHGHMDFLLNALDADASTGVYLASLTLSASGVESTDPIYFVFGYGLEEPALDEAIEAAEEWVESNLVPEPGALSLMLLGAMGCLPIRRSRR